jgi:hypothetical protein
MSAKSKATGGDRLSAAAVSTALVLALVLTQFAGPLIHLADVASHAEQEAGSPAGVASSFGIESDACATARGHEASECLLCLSLTQNRDDFFVEVFEGAVPTFTVGRVQILAVSSGLPSALPVALSPRAPPAVG